MELGEKLRASVGKDIKDFCLNGFGDPRLNHCAHFASHMCGLTFSYHCKEHVGGRKEAANIRVHEMFEQCPKVGRWEQADTSRPQLIFVTLAKNVDLDDKKMVNIPKKHVGVFHGGTVYHYGNTADRVVADTPDSFKAKFDRVYGPGQGYFFGWFPGEDLMLSVKPQGAQASAGKKFDIPDPVGGLWRARLVGEAQDFPVGREVDQPAKKYHGIRNNIPENKSPIFTAADYEEFDQWAVLLEVTGFCESGNRFNLVNTYDRAKFTFGFYQLAAHTPRDNLILLFHRLARLPSFKDYFPELEIRNGKLTRIDANGSATNLEQELAAPNGEEQLLLFMNYLNPMRVPIDRQEVLQAARLIHWTGAEAEARRAQVEVAADILQRKMLRSYAPKLGLDGKSDTICAIVADIFHQGRAGRGGYNVVRGILANPKPVAALLKVGETNYPERCRQLRERVEAAERAGMLGKKVYSRAANEFV